MLAAAAVPLSAIWPGCNNAPAHPPHAPDRFAGEVLHLPTNHAVAAQPAPTAEGFPVLENEGAHEAPVELALRHHANRPTSRASSWGLNSTLQTCLREADVHGAVDAARALRGEFGLAHVHAMVASCLLELDNDHRGADPLANARLLATARQLLAALQPAKPAAASRVVALGTVPGEQHTLGLIALGQQLHEAGIPTVVVEHTSLSTLEQLVAHPRVMALVLSAHVTMSVREARAIVAALRQASPHAALIGGGGGFPTHLRGMDLVTDDVGELMTALEARTNPLTQREQQILLGVAQGMTNTAIADGLGISPTTVKTHLDHVFTKTDTVHRAAAVARALRERWIR